MAPVRRRRLNCPMSPSLSCTSWPLARVTVVDIVVPTVTAFRVKKRNYLFAMVIFIVSFVRYLRSRRHQSSLPRFEQSFPFSLFCPSFFDSNKTRHDERRFIASADDTRFDVRLNQLFVDISRREKWRDLDPDVNRSERNNSVDGHDETRSSTSIHTFDQQLELVDRLIHCANTWHPEKDGLESSWTNTLVYFQSNDLVCTRLFRPEKFNQQLIDSREIQFTNEFNRNRTERLDKALGSRWSL